MCAALVARVRGAGLRAQEVSNGFISRVSPVRVRPPLPPLRGVHFAGVAVTERPQHHQDAAPSTKGSQEGICANIASAPRMSSSRKSV